jgi:hypothetical protein
VICVKIGIEPRRDRRGWPTQQVQPAILAAPQVRVCVKIGIEPRRDRRDWPTQHVQSATWQPRHHESVGKCGASPRHYWRGWSMSLIAHVVLASPASDGGGERRALC